MAVLRGSIMFFWPARQILAAYRVAAVAAVGDPYSCQDGGNLTFTLLPASRH